MKIITAVVASLISLSAMADYNFKPTKVTNQAVVATPSVSKNTVVLDESIVLLRGVIDGQSVGKAIKALLNVKGNDILLFIDSPGGSVMSGMQLIDVMQGLISQGKSITCISQFAASMAFVTTQACPKRIVLNSSVLMQHQASWGLQGGSEENNKSFIKLLLTMTEKIVKAQADRIGMSTTDFRKLVLSDYWVLGEDIVKMNMADEVKSVVCSEKLSNSTTTDRFMFMGIIPVTIVWSNCPLIADPLDIMIGQVGSRNLTEKELSALQNEITNRSSFPKDAAFIKNLNK